MSYLFAILLFSVLIFVHELGHFAAAKAFGVQVNEFSIFMGPPIWKKQIGETLYAVRCIPIGGFCAMEGEDGGSNNPRSFGNAAWWKRLIILVAGAAMNFVMGVILIAIVFAPSEQFVVPIVSQVEANSSLAGPNGVQDGDVLYTLDGERVYAYSDFSLLMSLNEGERHDLVVLRDGKKLVMDDLLIEKREFGNEDGTTSLRYGFSFTVAEADFAETVKYVWNNVLDNVRLVRLSIQMLFTGKAGMQDVSGPVGIVREMALVADEAPSAMDAFLNLLYFGGFIAINLAVMNLLPLPALDGGRVVGLLLTTAIELLIGKKINPKYEGYVHGVGMFLLLTLMGIILFKDILFAIKR